VLVGDTTENENVNASDVSVVKLHSGQVIDAHNFRGDIITNGVINASDSSAAKSKSGRALPLVGLTQLISFQAAVTNIAAVGLLAIAR
jgi:hypothetical protein